MERFPRYTSRLALLSLVCVTLQLAAALPTDNFPVASHPMQKIPLFLAEYPGCPTYVLKETESSQKMTLHGQLSFIIKPSHQKLFMDIAIDGQNIYQADINEKDITLSKCTMDYASCSNLKSTRLEYSPIKVGTTNYFNVTRNENTISVSVKDNENIMDNLMTFTPSKDGEYSPEVTVTLIGSSVANLQPVKLPSKTPQQQQTITIRERDFPRGYKVEVNVKCNATHMPEKDDMGDVPSTTPAPEMKPKPYPECSYYEINNNYELRDLEIQDSIEIAVYPNKPYMHMHVLVNDMMYKVIFQSSMAEVLKCKEYGQECEKLHEGGSKTAIYFKAHDWSIVGVSLTEENVKITINGQSDIIDNHLEIPGTDIEKIKVSILSLMKPVGQEQINTDYNIAVNIHCNNTFKPTPRMDEITTYNPLNTPEPHVEVTTPSNEEETGSNTTLIIIVVILAVILAIIIGAFVYTSHKKKQSANINQHSPLNDQQQRLD